jgi:hypothetical protein
MASAAEGPQPGAVEKKSSMEGLLELLRERGILSGSETADFKQRFAEEKAQAVEEELKKRQGPPPLQVVKNKELPPLKTTLPEAALTGLIDKAGQQQVLTPEEAALVKERYQKRAAYEQSLAAAKGKRLPERDLRSLLEVMKEQGLVGADEAQELSARLSTEFEAAEKSESTVPANASPVPEMMPSTVITAERQIPYIRSSMPPEDLLVMIDRAGAQRVLLPWETAFVKARYHKKAGLDQVAEAVSGDVKTEMRAEVNKAAKEEVASAGKSIAAPAWTKKISLSGDMRLRYESIMFDEGNYDGMLSPIPDLLMNTTEDRQRLRMRARLNANIKVNDEVGAVFSLATGSSSDPVSTNQTMGGYFNKKSVQVDRASVSWQPASWLALQGGRFSNPWFSTDLVWDTDLNFDGVAAKAAYRLTPEWTFAATAGVFPLEEVELSQKDKWLFGGQLEAVYTKENAFAARIGAAYYDYKNVSGTSYTATDVENYSDPQFMQKGNSVFNINTGATDPADYVLGLLADFKLLNLTAQLDLGYWHPFHLIFMADYVTNLGFDRAEMAQKAGVSSSAIAKGSGGYQLSLMAGNPKVREQWDWRAFLSYKRLEADAVLDAFTDSDFHTGGTNAKGWILGGELGLLKNTSVSARWITTNEVSGPAFSADTLQVDLNVKF